MKNKSFSKKFGKVFSVICALAVAVLFWLVVKYLDSGASNALACAQLW